jgi:hypothetical protein
MLNRSLPNWSTESGSKPVGPFRADAKKALLHLLKECDVGASEGDWLNAI